MRIEYDRPRAVRLGTPGSQSMFHGCTGVVVENPLSEPIKVELDGQSMWRYVYEEERYLRVLDPVVRELARVAFADIRDVVEWDDQGMVVKSSDRLAPEAGRAVAEISERPTREALLQVSSQHFDLTGEIWWVLLRNAMGMPVEMWPVRPDRMRPVPHPQEYISGYVYTVGSQQIPLNREDVFFARRPNPVDPYRGIGVVQSILNELGTEQLSARWTKLFFYNSAESGGIIEYEDEDPGWSMGSIGVGLLGSLMAGPTLDLAVAE